MHQCYCLEKDLFHKQFLDLRNWKITMEFYRKETIRFTGIDAIRLMCDCVAGSTVIGIGQIIFLTFALEERLGYQKVTNRLIMFYQKLIFHFLLEKYFYFSIDQSKVVDFRDEVITFTLDFLKI